MLYKFGNIGTCVRTVSVAVVAGEVSWSYSDAVVGYQIAIDVPWNEVKERNKIEISNVRIRQYIVKGV